MKPKQRPILGQLGDLDLRLLRVFKTVVDCGGMAAAELELNIGISTISRHVKDLEQRLALRLCSRGRGGFALTAEGARVHAETLRLLSATDQFRSSIDDIHERMAGELQVAVFDKTATNPEARIGQAIAAFSDQAPAVHLHLHVGSINTIERGVIDGQFQVGVIPAHRSSQSLQYQHLFNETMQLYCGQRHVLFSRNPAPSSWVELRDHRFAGLGYHSPNMEISQQAQLVRAATGFDQESIATLILSGEFLGFLPDHYAKTFASAGQMRALRPERFSYPVKFVAITRRSPQPPRTAMTFASCLLQAHQALSDRADPGASKTLFS
jgi:DNA-binding transcriptional LysR family regulator